LHAAGQTFGKVIDEHVAAPSLACWGSDLRPLLYHIFSPAASTAD
jgi:hypothetical protein